MIEIQYSATVFLFVEYHPLQETKMILNIYVRQTVV